MKFLIRSVIPGLALLLLWPQQMPGAPKASGPDPYYTEKSDFFPSPDSRGPAWKVPNFGPVGLGLELTPSNFTMKITRVEKGSPADQTGKFKAGQIIESVNGEVFKARDSSSMKSFYATNWFHSAHTGGGIGEIWHNVTVCMMKDKRPGPYRSYLDTRRWVMDLSRRFDGGIGIAGLADRYDVATGEHEIAWGNFFALTYTAHRNKLQMFGAPKSPYAKPFQLPERPWGNATDDVFQEPGPLPHPSITLEDLLKEKVETDSSAPAMGGWGKIQADGGYLKYLHHPEHELRSAMALRLASQGRADLILSMLKSSDPRGRECGLVSLIGDKKSEPFAAESLTTEMKDLVEKMFTDPDESWWVKVNAIYAMKRWSPELAVKHKSSLLAYLEHEDWWLQMAALEALQAIATDPQHAKDILPRMADLFGRTRISRILIFSRKFQNSLEQADKELKVLAMRHFRNAFDAVPREFVDPTTGYVMRGGAKYARTTLAGILVNLPGGVEIGRNIPKTTVQSAITGKDEDMYVFAGTIRPDARFAGKWKEVAEVMDPATIEAEVNKRATRLASLRDQLEKREQRRAAAGVKPKLDKKGRPKKSRGPLEKALQAQYLELGAQGQVGTSKLFFWTDDVLVDNGLGEARKMKLHTINGKTYLLVEKGGFIQDPSSKEIDKDDSSNDERGGGTTTITTTTTAAAQDQGDSTETRPPGWHCGFKVYVRAE